MWSAAKIPVIYKMDDSELYGAIHSNTQAIDKKLRIAIGIIKEKNSATCETQTILSSSFMN